MILISSKTADAQTRLLQTRKGQVHYKSWLSSSICNVIATATIYVSKGHCKAQMNPYLYGLRCPERQGWGHGVEWECACLAYTRPGFSPHHCLASSLSRYSAIVMTLAVSAAVAWSCVNDLRKELSFQRLIFFLHKSEHSEYFANSVPDFK